MQAEIESGAALSGANALLAHLRKHPEEARKRPAELAKLFGLDEPFVATVLENVRERPKQDSVKIESRGPSVFAVIWGGISEAWRRVTSRPILFVIATFIACFAVGVIITQVVATEGSGSPRIVVGTGTSASSQGSVVATPIQSGVYMALCIMLTFFLHMSVYYRHRSARYPLYGALFLWISASSILAGIALLSPNSIRSANLFAAIAFGSMGMLMISLLYAGCGALAAIVGGYVDIRRQEKSEQSMTRQELLERYFELQSRLESTAYPRAVEGSMGFLNSPAIVFYRERPYIFNLILGFTLSGLALLGATAVRVEPGANRPELNVWLFGLMFVGITSFLSFIVSGYLQKTALRVVLGAVCIHGGGWLVRLISLGVASLAPSLGLDFKVPNEFKIGDSGFWLSDFGDLVFMTFVSFAGFMGSRVQNRAIRESALARNDQATLLAEMVRIQWRLNTDAGSVCVMVVDAARSSEMKADADPLLVEYTFREYQEWIERLSAPRGGRIHSTAGDGAVVTFTSCSDALDVARKLQSDIHRFNKDENRLKLPFRLRIGLHVGEVAGDIGQVQFSEVIDIAAHMEGAAPIGGITVSDSVAERMADEALIDLNRLIDGHRVLMVANPAE